MLVQKGYAEGDIVCFKIITGEELVAKIVEVKDTGFLVSKPCSVLPSERGIGLMQTLMCGDINTNVTLNNQHVILHAPAIKDIQNHYIRTTTGIEPASSGIIT